MQNLITKLKLFVRDESLRRRVLFTVGALAIFRFMAAIPVPGIDLLQLELFFQQNQFFGLLNVFTGGGLSNLSLVMLGVGPYITASIIMQLGTMIIPKLKEMYQEEGEAGRRKFSQYSRMLSIPLALMQGYAFLTLLIRQGAISELMPLELIMNIIAITAGSVLLMWIGELISEFGIGNGTSLIIFGGIVASLPQSFAQLAFSFDVAQLPLYIGFAAAAVAIVAGVVAMTEAERTVPVTYAKRVRGNKVYGGVSTYLPLRLNQAGVIPIIFALSILLFPQMIVNFISTIDRPFVQQASAAILDFLNTGWLYASMYFVLVFLFTYFYTAVTFDPDNIANNLQKSGAFIVGIRPGPPTASYLGKIVTRITFVGALFLGVIAVLPMIMQAATGVTSFAIGGTALLIVVSVVLDLVRKIGAQLSMREY